jgi:hypothetical protein
MPWNEAFARKSVELRDGSDALELDGGLVLTLLSPDRPKLVALLPRWEEECREQGLMPGRVPERTPSPRGLEAMGVLNIEGLALEPFEPGRTAPNGTSIAVLAEYGGRRVLLAADAHPDRLIGSLKGLRARSGCRSKSTRSSCRTTAAGTTSRAS